ncbi:MAG: (2Fe-2S)-binding protein [Clostridia bacterium]|nr:(2Fe-2S)-binding protein [Clostridia bacterium]
MRFSDHPILDFNINEKKLVKFTFEGKQYEGFEDEPIAAALHDNGIKKLRTSPKLKRSRGLFCAIGKCSSCLMKVDGIPNVRTCVEPLKEGMVVEYQNSKGDLPEVDG